MADSQTPNPNADPTIQPDRQHLLAEARYLHACLFAFPIADRIAERYADAHQHMQLADGVDLRRVVERRLDAEAIEIYLRRRSPQNTLSQKLRTLLYLVEIEAEYYPHFVRDKGGLLSALPALVLSPIRSVYKLMKGAVQTRRHHVA